MNSVYYFYHTQSTVVARTPMQAVAYFMEYQGEEEYTYRKAKQNYTGCAVAFISVNDSAFIGVQKLDPEDLPEGFSDAPEGTIRPFPLGPDAE